MAFGRQYLIDAFIDNPLPVRVFAMVHFEDDFGAYRNMYRALLAMYSKPGNLLSGPYRTLRNTRLSTVAPFGCGVGQAVEAMSPIHRQLDRGLVMRRRLDEEGQTETIFVSAIHFIHVSDLPQQNDSAGVMRYNATIGCRSCLIDSSHRNELDFNTVLFGRYLFEMNKVRRTATSTRAKGKAKEILRQIGLASHTSPWKEHVSSTINEYQHFAIDAFHSELSGMTKLVLSMLTTWLLTEKRGCSAFIAALGMF